MAGTLKSNATADLSIDNAYRNTQQRKDPDQTPSHKNPSIRTPLYNAFPTLRSASYNPSSAAFQDNTLDSEEHHLKLDLPSWPKFATHTAPNLKPLGRLPQLETAGIHRRLCFSLDEKALFDLHNRHQYFSTTNSQQRSSGPSDQEPQRTAPEPIAPPCAPPRRTRTPDGVPSWPGLLPLHQQQQWNARQQMQKRGGNLMRRGSRRLARFFADILDSRPGRRNGGKPRARRMFGLKRYREESPLPVVARWRPPMSGHSTFRFDSLDAHPFSGPSLSDEPYVGGPFNGVRPRRKVFPSDLLESRRSGSEDLFGLVNAHGIRAQLQRRPEAIPPADGRRRHAMSRPSRSSGSDNSVIISPSVRALAALRGLPLPVSLEQVEAETRRRSSSIPRSRVCSPVNGLGGGQRRFSYPTNTMRTVDLIEAFPSPPSQRTPCGHSVPARMSLFPAVTTLKERSGNVQATLSPSKKRLEVLESVVASAKKRKRASASSSSGPLQSTLTRVGQNAESPSASNAWVSGALPEPSDRDGSADMTAYNSPPLRGEEVDRYRSSGTPVYDRNTTSLCSVDETEDVDITVLVTRPDTPVSGKTGMTRYFSAASQVVPNRSMSATMAPSALSEPLKQIRDEHQVQRERAAANGALRFSFQDSTDDTGFRASPPSRPIANVPVRTTSLTKTCSHKASAIRMRRSVGWDSFDGTQETEDGSAQESGRKAHCFRCEVKRVVRRMARVVRGQDQART
jgi:hypothetical protein